MSVLHKKWLELSLLIFIVLVFPLCLIVLFPNIPDADIFYHIKHALVYRQYGLLDTSFPWAYHSIMALKSVDFWWGFHMLILPFTFFPNSMVGANLAGSLFYSFVILSVFSASKLFSSGWGILWILFLTQLSAATSFRFTVLRPHAISIAFVVLTWVLFWVSEKASDKRKYLILGFVLLGFVMAWIHLTVVWVGIAVFLGNLFIYMLTYRKFPLDFMISYFFGIFLGIFLRPSPLITLETTAKTVIAINRLKREGVVLNFGNEILPGEIGSTILSSQIFFFPVLIIALIFFVILLKKKILDKRQTGALVFCVLTVLGSLVLTLSWARRMGDFYLVFGAIFCAIVFEIFYKKVLKTKHKRAFIISLIIYLFLSGTYSFYKYGLTDGIGGSPDKYQEVSNWLKENTREGDIVYNISWDQFAPLFYANHHNYYINGLDPVMIHLVSEELSWKYFSIFIQQDPFTACGKPRCLPQEREDTHKVLKEDFKAKYVFVTPNHRLFRIYLDTHKGYRKVFENRNTAVFRVL